MNCTKLLQSRLNCMRRSILLSLLMHTQCRFTVCVCRSSLYLQDQPASTPGRDVQLRMYRLNVWLCRILIPTWSLQGKIYSTIFTLLGEDEAEELRVLFVYRKPSFSPVISDWISVLKEARCWRAPRGAGLSSTDIFKGISHVYCLFMWINEWQPDTRGRIWVRLPVRQQAVHKTLEQIEMPRVSLHHYFIRRMSGWYFRQPLPIYQGCHRFVLHPNTNLQSGTFETISMIITVIRKTQHEFSHFIYWFFLSR